MALLLNVPFSEKDEAKALGAKWNPELKRWYTNKKSDYGKFKRWFFNKETDLIVSERVFIVVGEQECFRCHGKTKVVSLAADSYVLLDDDCSEVFDEDINFINSLKNPPMNLQKFLFENYKYYNGYSKTTKSNYFGNHCNCCGVLQGDFYLYSEPGSPFFIMEKEQAQELTVYSIKLPHDLELAGSVGWGSEDHLIKEYARFIDLDLDLFAEM